MISEKELEEQIRDATDLDQLARTLQELLSGSYTVWPNGQLTCMKGLVERVYDLRIIFRPNDHPPPHFHVKGQDLNASFEIATGELWKGTIDPHHNRLIKDWWCKRARTKLTDFWNATRPTG
jgi:hypothetical protein